MNTETKNDRSVRKAAIAIGFVGLLVLIAWLSIMIVRNVPGSFASLASLAESVRSFDASQVENASDDEAVTADDPQSMLIVTSDTNVIESNKNVRLSWTDTSAQGSFVFYYKCTDGVSITIVEEGGVRNINCDTNYNLGDVNNVTLAIASENERYVDVEYSIAFLGKNDVEPKVSDTANITVVNEEVPLFSSDFALADDDASEEETDLTPVVETESVEEVPETLTEEPINDEVLEESMNEPAVEASIQTETEAETVNEETSVAEGGFNQEFTYTVPVSDPDGRVDLATRFIATGKIINGSFLTGDLEDGEAGAIQFEVKNLGTKTSETWAYEVSLTSGQSVVSDGQEALKPNERALITIGFPTYNADGSFEVTIDTNGDYISVNDRFIY